MAGGEFRLGTDSIYMAEYGQTGLLCTSLKYYITWLRFRRISGALPSDSSGLVVKGRRKLGLGSLACVAALLGITAGTLYQKRHCAGMDLRTGGVVQFGAAGLATAPLALLFEDAHVDWSGEFVFALLWLVLVLSLGAVSLLYVLIRRGATAQVASLFFLVPPCTALIAWPLFGETLGPVAMIGMVLTATGVALASRRRPGSGCSDKDRYGSEADLHAGPSPGPDIIGTRSRPKGNA